MRHLAGTYIGFDGALTVTISPAGRRYRIEVKVPLGRGLLCEGATFVSRGYFAGKPACRDALETYLDWPKEADWWRFAGYLCHCFGRDLVEFMGNAVENGEAFHCKKQGI
jgi:hypothetical protein